MSGAPDDVTAGGALRRTALYDRHIAAGCDRVVEIDDGRIIRDFRPGEFGEDENWRQLAPCNCRERVRGFGSPTSP